MSSSSDAPKRRESMHKKSGLVLRSNHLSRLLKGQGGWRVSPTVPTLLAGALEYLLSEVLDGAMKHQSYRVKVCSGPKDPSSATLTGDDFSTSIRDDEELNNVLSSINFGGLSFLNRRKRRVPKPATTEVSSKATRKEDLSRKTPKAPKSKVTPKKIPIAPKSAFKIVHVKSKKGVKKAKDSTPAVSSPEKKKKKK